ncbi:MAG: molecular chaperone HtpG [Spirochaetaceae bacterium]|jgi:molecular chaperone HtpG|nr:molecular chaperone HtpG [Spirochaetaceae bacterium]
MAQRQFQTEVSQLLNLIIHSLYSNREIFLREIVSNASDALDKLKYLTVSDEAYKGIAFEPRVDISFDKNAKTLTIADNGIGMNEDDLVESLGTIARSGTKAFLEKLSADAKKDSNLIGQFGVGFYSAFMVAGKIEVISRKALDERAWKWSSDGKDGYEIESAQRDSQGSTVILNLTDEGAEYADRWRIENIIKQYSNHVAYPIFLTFDDKEYDDKGEVKATKQKTERINEGTALWRKAKSDLKDADYHEFYKQIAHDSDEPLFYLHTKAEGALEYSTLFFVPKKAPFDMYHADYKPGVKLYVKRVFITDDDKDLLPVYLRFLRGVIDSEDLPLNVSREILQQNKVLANIKNASVKKVLAEFKKIAETDSEKWLAFITQFNRPLKEGLYSDWANREELAELVRFKSSAVEGWTSLSAYTSRMKGDQKFIYYISGGGGENTLKSSPLLEAYKAKNIEVLVMDEEIDDIVIPSLSRYKKVTGLLDKDGKESSQEWELKSVNRAGADEELGNTENKDAEKSAEPIIEKIKKALGERVKDVKLSRRLLDSPSCIVADENDPSIQMAQMMRAMGQAENLPEVKPILEVNGEHPLVKSLAAIEDEAKIADTSAVLLDQALLVEGLKLKDPADFVQRLNRLLSAGA